MESVDLGVGEIFSDVDDDDDIGAPAVLQDLPEGNSQELGENDDDAENTEVLSRLKDLSKGAAKKVIRRAQPKLDPTRLTGDRGIPILPKMCEKLKFKGKGHEAEDLGRLMKALEHWGHRLFPKMPFDEVLERCERLGSKNEVQTCIKKMRLGMPVLGDEFVGSDKDDSDEDVVRRSSTNAQDDPVVDEWDNMLREEAELNAAGSKAPPRPSIPDELDLPGPSTSTSLSQGLPSTPAPPSGSDVHAPQNVGFTPDQLERMEKNREMARQKRLTKTGVRGSPAAPRQHAQLSQTQQDLSPFVARDLGSSQPSPRLHSPGTTTSVDGRSRSQTEASVSKDTEQLAGDVDGGDSVNANINTDRIVPSKGQIQTEVIDDSEMEVSEVIEKQENCVAKLKAEDAQHWNSETQVLGKESETSKELLTGKDSETLNDTENETASIGQTATETHDSTSILNEDCEMSPVTENQEEGKISHDNDNSLDNEHTDIMCNGDESSVGDSAEMSEVIGFQDVSSKPKPLAEFKNIQKDSETLSDIIPKQNFSATTVKTKMDNGNLLDEGMQDSESTIDPANKENTYTDNERTPKKCHNVTSVNETGDNERMDDFDDELTEEQLMETLE